MKSERWQQIEGLYYAALEREPRERAAFLESACAGDETLRREVASLIAASDRIGSFMEPPVEQSTGAATGAAPQPSMIGERLGHYRILSLLGRGGMGEVYLAEDTTLGRKVALKLLPGGFTSDCERLRRFKQEARAVSALNHPNIITIYEIAQSNGTHYLVTEHVEGETLRQRIQREPLSLSSALDIAVQVASALAASHPAGITHRDIKPENVMVRPDGLVKVLDFGLAKLEESPAVTPESGVSTQAQTAGRLSTAPGMVMGTFSYMSPEQARGLKVDHRTDIFSLGVMLYELVAGRRPFEGATPSDVIAEILRGEPLPVTQLKPGLSPELEQLISRMLAKEREARYQSAPELLTDLRHLRREGATAVGVEQGAGEAAGRTEARPRQISRFARLTVFSTLVLAIGGTYWFYIRPDSDRPPYRDGQATNKEIHSLAILPFVNASADPNEEYLSDGITESLINDFSRLPQLQVIARTTAFRYKGKDTDAKVIGRDLRVDAIIAGKVTLQGDRLIVQADLVNTADGAQIWGERYSRKLSDIFAVQEQIAEELSEKLRLRLTGQGKQALSKRYTENIRAYQNYLQGRSYAQRRTREGLLTAITYYEKAIGEDINYALAFAGLADAYTQQTTRLYVRADEGRRKAKEAARRALSLDENLAEAHTVIGQSDIFFAPFRFATGDRELRRAIELSPSLAVAYHFLGISLLEQGRLKDALDAMLKARELDPLSPTIARMVAFSYLLKRDYRRALELLQQARELGPPFIFAVEIEIYIQNRFFGEALSELENARRERKEDLGLVFSTGMVYAAQGRRAEALKIIKELEQVPGMSQSPEHWIARIYATLDEKELALTFLERGLEAEAIGVFYKDSPIWDTVRSDPRFADLLRRMRVPL